VEVRAVGRYRRVSPSKARRVVNLLRKRSYSNARGILRNMASPTAQIVLKILESARANAEHNHEAGAEKLFVSRCYVDDSIRWKRLEPRARGRVNRIHKRCSHVTIYLSDGVED
jgi:large subunit ribosomal protein L22